MLENEYKWNDKTLQVEVTLDSAGTFGQAMEAAIEEYSVIRGLKRNSWNALTCHVKLIDSEIRYYRVIESRIKYTFKVCEK